MMNFDQQPEHDELQAWENARRRHPSWVDPLDHHDWEPVHTLQREETEALAVVLSQLHDFFREGNPDSSAELQTFLLENNAGMHAEVLLDQVQTLGSAALRFLAEPPSGEPW